MKKHKVRKTNGVKVVEKIKKDHDRPLIPPGVVFDIKTKYNRKREKQLFQKQIKQDTVM